MNKMMKLSTSSTGFSTEKRAIRLELIELSTALARDRRYAEKVIHNFAGAGRELAQSKRAFRALL